MKTQPWAILLVALTTLVTASAQALYKAGVADLILDTTQLTTISGIFWFCFNLLTTPYIFMGLSLYVVGFIMLMIAYKGGEASVLYPIFSSSYVWVVLMGYFIFGEAINASKIGGVLFIVLGIIVLAKGNSATTMEVPA